MAESDKSVYVESPVSLTHRSRSFKTSYFESLTMSTDLAVSVSGSLKFT